MPSRLPGRLSAATFTSARHGYGLFTAQRGGRCRAEVGATSDGGRRFTRPALVTSWSCDDNSPAVTLAAQATGAVAFFGRADRDGVVFGYDGSHNERPAIWRTADGGAHWRVVYPVLT